MCADKTSTGPEPVVPPWPGPRARARPVPKGRQTDPAALAEVSALLGDRPRRRDLLIEHLHLIQDARGHLPAPLLRALADEMRLSMAEVWEVASFYAHFDPVREDEAPPPPVTVRVCDSLSCQLAGAEALMVALRAGTDPAAVRIVAAPCMGRCDTAPVAVLGQRPLDRATPDAVQATLAAGTLAPDLPPAEGLAAARARGAYAALTRLRDGGDWQGLQALALKAGLRGLGGAGFAAGRKWGFVRAHPGPRYLAVNADEGEPGTFKDRWLLERTPHTVLEGALIAAWAVEAARVYLYLRDEYPAARDILLREIAALEGAGLIASGYIELRRGAGAYICGEESAMLESIEGKRGLPRHRPPYVAESGLWGRPTLVHNVETLHWLARIAQEGPGVLADTVANGRRGRRLYSVSGRVARPGVYDLPAGSTLNDVIEAAGGMAPGQRLKAFQPGGPSSGLLPAALADVPLDFGTLEEHGSFAGSGAVVVLGQGDSVAEAARGMLAFFAHESCGQCTPCRAGCAKAVDLMAAPVWDADLLGALCDVMADASICGLGQAAPNAIRLTLRHFPEEVGG